MMREIRGFSCIANQILILDLPSKTFIINMESIETKLPLERHDWLKYLDIITKVVVGLILAVATFFINTNNEIQKRSNELKQKEIDNNLKYGDFTKSLMTELLNKDTTSHLHRDIALIILNRTLGDENQKLIANIGYSLVLDYLQNNSRNADQRSIQTVISIVKERDIVTYNTIDDLWKSYNAETKVVEGSSKETNEAVKKNADTNIVSVISKEKLDKLTLFPSVATVFIQVNNNDEPTRAKARVCLSYLKNVGFNTPGIEAITSFKFPNTIKYFYDNDFKSAKIIQEKMNAQFGDSIIIQRQYNTKARPGIIEVWWNPK